MNLRPYIKGLIKNLLTAEDAVLDINRVEVNRPHKLILKNLPIILVYGADETVDTWAGSDNRASLHRRKYMVTIEVVTHQQPDSDNFLDKIACQIEFILFGTENLGDTQDCVDGFQLISTKTFSFDDGSETTYDSCQLQFEVPYITDAVLDKKYANFTEYDAKFNRVGWNDSTVDPTLIEAEGTINQ